MQSMESVPAQGLVDAPTQKLATEHPKFPKSVVVFDDEDYIVYPNCGTLRDKNKKVRPQHVQCEQERKFDGRFTKGGKHPNDCIKRHHHSRKNKPHHVKHQNFDSTLGYPGEGTVHLGGSFNCKQCYPRKEPRNLYESCLIHYPNQERVCGSSIPQDSRFQALDVDQTWMGTPAQQKQQYTRLGKKLNYAKYFGVVFDRCVATGKRSCNAYFANALTQMIPLFNDLTIIISHYTNDCLRTAYHVKDDAFDWYEMCQLDHVDSTPKHYWSTSNPMSKDCCMLGVCNHEWTLTSSPFEVCRQAVFHQRQFRARQVFHDYVCVSEEYFFDSNCDVDGKIRIGLLGAGSHKGDGPSTPQITELPCCDAGRLCRLKTHKHFKAPLEGSARRVQEAKNQGNMGPRPPRESVDCDRPTPMACLPGRHQHGSDTSRYTDEEHQVFVDIFESKRVAIPKASSKKINDLPGLSRVTANAKEGEKEIQRFLMEQKAIENGMSIRRDPTIPFSSMGLDKKVEDHTDVDVNDYDQSKFFTDQKRLMDLDAKRSILQNSDVVNSDVKCQIASEEDLLSRRDELLPRENKDREDKNVVQDLINDQLFQKQDSVSREVMGRIQVMYDEVMRPVKDNFIKNLFVSKQPPPPDIPPPSPHHVVVKWNGIGNPPSGFNVGQPDYVSVIPLPPYGLGKPPNEADLSFFETTTVRLYFNTLNSCAKKGWRYKLARFMAPIVPAMHEVQITHVNDQSKYTRCEEFKIEDAKKYQFRIGWRGTPRIEWDHLPFAAARTVDTINLLDEMFNASAKIDIFLPFYSLLMHPYFEFRQSSPISTDGSFILSYTQKCLYLAQRIPWFPLWDVKDRIVTLNTILHFVQQMFVDARFAFTAQPKGAKTGFPFRSAGRSPGS